MKELKIGNITLDTPIVLAPMAGITNLAYRKLLKPYGCGEVVTEMVSDFALIYGNKETREMVKVDEGEHPVAVQLFGGSVDSLIKGAKILLEIGGFDILDINLGCPVPKVVKENAGSSWLKLGREEELFNAIKGICDVSNVPVTCKIRVGWDETSVNVVSTCQLLEKAGVSAIAIHGRTRTQYYAGHANYDYIKQAKEAVSIPIIANGDIRSLDDALKVIEYTNCDGVMIGRGALGNPHLIKQLEHYFKTGERLPDASLEERIEQLKTHFRLLKELKGEFKAVSEMRGLSAHYIANVPNSKKYRFMLTQMHSEDELFSIIDEIKSDYFEKNI